MGSTAADAVDTRSAVAAAVYVKALIVSSIQRSHEGRENVKKKDKAWFGM
jgi:hypothetical protein